MDDPTPAPGELAEAERWLQDLARHADKARQNRHAAVLMAEYDRRDFALAQAETNAAIMRGNLNRLRRQVGHCNGKQLTPPCGYCGSDRQCERCEAIASTWPLTRDLAAARTEIERLVAERDLADQMRRNAMELHAQAHAEAERLRANLRVTSRIASESDAEAEQLRAQRQAVLDLQRRRRDGH